MFKQALHPDRRVFNTGTPRNCVSCIAWNIRGISDKLSNANLQQYLFKHEVIVLLETMKDSDFLLDIPDYKFYHFARKMRNLRARRASGGIGVFIKNTLSPGIKVFSSSDICVWIHFDKAYFGLTRPLYIACVYIPPICSSHRALNDNYFDVLESEIARFSLNADIMLCGDFNARTGNQSDQPSTVIGSNGAMDTNTDNDELHLNVPLRQSIDSTVNTYGKELLKLCKCSNLIICNGRFGEDKAGKYTCYTARGKSMVDYLIISPQCLHLLHDFCIEPLLVDSDHCPIYFNLCIPVVSQDKGTISSQRQTMCYYKWDKKRVLQYHKHLTSENAYNLLSDFTCALASNATAEYVCDTFYNYLDTAVASTFEVRKMIYSKKFPSNKWFDHECKQLKRKVNTYAKAYDITNPVYWTQYKLLQRDYRQVAQKKKREYKFCARSRLENMISQNPQEYWDFLKSMARKPQVRGGCNLEIFYDHFRMHSEPPVTAYFDYNFLNNVMKLDLDKIDCNIESSSLQAIKDILNKPITEEELVARLRRLKNKKACGIDGLSSEFLKYAEDILLQPLLALYNYMLEHGDFPAQWAEGIVNPLYKKGAWNNPDNYRRITLLNTLGKLFESILNGRLCF